MLVDSGKLWGISLIKQKFNTWAAFRDIQSFQIIKINLGNLRPLSTLLLRCTMDAMEAETMLNFVRHKNFLV